MRAGNPASRGDFGSEAREIDDEEFADYPCAIAYAQELSQKYGVPINHRY